MTVQQPIDAAAPAGRADLPGDSGVWVFIIADMSAFALFFLVFMIGRAGSPQLYETSRQMLDGHMGLANTLILLTSGAVMAGASRAAQHGRWHAARLHLMGTLVVGSAFGVCKALEWHEKIARGITLTTNEFFSYYFMFTGIHFLHFIVGVGVLLVLIVASGDGARPAAVRLRWIEAGGAYWHMVDLLWIFLFAMLYLMRAS